MVQKKGLSFDSQFPELNKFMVESLFVTSHACGSLSATRKEPETGPAKAVLAYAIKSVGTKPRAFRRSVKTAEARS